MPDTRNDWRHQYDEDRDAYEQALTDITPVGPTLTQAHFAKDADINEIVKRFGVKDGSIPPLALDPRFFGNFEGVPDFRQALDNIREANDRFALLPAATRARFNNDPLELWAFVNNPLNEDEAVRLELLKREAAPPVPPITPV